MSDEKPKDAAQGKEGPEPQAPLTEPPAQKSPEPAAPNPYASFATVKNNSGRGMVISPFHWPEEK